jgi:hypothetical protein
VIVRPIAHAARHSVCTHSLTSDVGDQKGHLAAIDQCPPDFLGPDCARLNVLLVLKNRQRQGFGRAHNGAGLITVTRRVAQKQIELVIALTGFLRDPAQRIGFPFRSACPTRQGRGTVP